MASNIYSLSLTDSDNYDKYEIILHFICEKTILFCSLVMYLLPRPDNYLSVSPNILNSLNINTESNRRHKSTFKDPKLHDKWDYHAGMHSETSYKDDDGNGLTAEYDDGATNNSEPHDWDDQASAVSYTTLMYRKDQQKLAKSAPKARGWLSYFTPSSSANQLHKNKNNNDGGGEYNEDLLIDVAETKQSWKNKKKKVPRVKKERYRSQGGQCDDDTLESSHSIRSMFSDK